MEYLQYSLNWISNPVLTLRVLNLIINGIPSILRSKGFSSEMTKEVLNLIINGIPSIRNHLELLEELAKSFKPYYKWNTFNTTRFKLLLVVHLEVLNLIINGIPSILDLDKSLNCLNF